MTCKVVFPGLRGNLKKKSVTDPEHTGLTVIRRQLPLSGGKYFTGQSLINVVTPVTPTVWE